MSTQQLEDHEYTLDELRAAAERCIANPQSADDRITAESLLRSVNGGSTAINIKAADYWFNKPHPRLPEFMRRYAKGA